MIARRRAKAALAWMPRALQPDAGPRAVPPARPGPVLRAVRFALLTLALGGVLLWSATAEAQTAIVLIKNTGQASGGSHTIDSSGNTGYAQAFTTGANPAGYTLSSIGFDFASITETSTAGAHLVVTLNGVDTDGKPDAALCTLTDPATFSGSGVQTFDAPTTDPCPTLLAGTTYSAVIERVASSAMASISLHRTVAAAEDSGGATGWSIENTLHTLTSGTWGSASSRSHRVEVRGYAVNNPATGAPTITGTPRVGEELTADTSAIMDADGLTNPGYSYQWVRVVGGSTTNIGTDSSTYTLTDDDAEKRIRVDVTFTDDLTNAEGPLSSALSDTIVPADVLVRNTGQTARSAGEDFDSLSPDLIAQGFTTGANAGGYTLDSIGVHFWSTADAFSPAANRISATLNADSSSEPGAELCSLTNPATFGASGLHPFAAPTMGTTCPTLHADTTYWVLVKNTATRSSRLSATDSGNEDPGGAAGWSIGDLHSQRQGPASTNAGDWINNFPRSILIEVKGSAADNNFATGAPSISGVLQQDEVLTADTAGIADADGLGTLSYQWLADGTPISGATSSTYTLTASEVRDAISLTVTFTDDEGYSESLTSAETPDVVATGATRKLLWLAKLTPGDRGFGAIGVNTSGNEDALSPSSFTYGSDTYEIDQIDFGPVPATGLSVIMSPVPGADEEEAWIVDTGREWLVSDDDISINKAGGQIFLLWPAVEGDVDWTIGQETVVYLLEVVNNPPAFTDTAPTTRSVDENTASAANIGAAVAATDPESDTLVYALTGTDASSFTIDTTSGQLKTSASLDFETDSSYSVNVTVHDGKDAVGVADTTVDATIAVTISVNNKDEAGTVTLPATFTGGTAATASVSDPDGTVSGPSWRWARGNTATGSFSNISGATSAGYTPVAADVGEYLRATVTYTDPQGSGKSASAVSSGAVGASNAEPTFDDGATATRTLPENSGAGVAVVGGVVAATDGDSDTLTYSLTGTDAARFEIDASGQIKVKTGSTHTFNFEAAKKSYSVTVSVRDSKDAAGNADTATDDTIAVTIDLTNVNEAPTITNLLDTPNVPENSSGTILLMASDVDVPDTQTWSVETTDDGSKFQVASGFLPTLSFKDQPDFETPIDVGDTAGNNTYVVTVKLTDSGGLSDTLTFTVTVTNVNEAPEITTNSGAAYIFSEAENTATSEVIETFEATDVDASTTLTWSLQGADAGDFTITPNADGEGELKFRNVPDFEDPKGSLGTDRNVYIFTVRVRDNGSPRKEDTIGVNLHVTDVNEAPVITSPPATRSVPENSTAVHTFAATDVDASDTQTWSVEPADDGGKFDINATTGALSFKDAPDFETPTDVGMDNSYVVTVKVQDDGTPAESDTHKVTVTVTNVNEAPEITTTATTYTAFNVDENTATTDVIKTYEATDVDASTTLTWSLEGNDAGDFTITKNADGHGELKFASAPNFEAPVDADTMNDYDIRVKVKDNGIPGNRGSSNQLDDTVTVVVNVLDINEAPVINGATQPDFAEIEYDATSPDLTIGAYTYTDEDRNPADTITWGLIGTDAPHFNIGSASGVLSFNMRPDFENPFGADNEYQIVVVADDAQGGVGSWAVIVTVTNVDETPAITTTAASHTAPSFMEIEYDATTADLVVADYDGRDEEGQTISWSRTGTDAGDFSIDSSTGVLSFAQRPNFEIPDDAGTDNVYNVTVRARDTASNTRELEVVVTVTDVNERPDINEDTVSSYAEIEYDFTGTRPDVHTFTATDYDAGDTIGWALAGTDAAYLEIDPTTGVLTFTQDSGFGHGPLPNFEHPRDDDAGDGSSNTYSIIVRAFDDATDKKTTDYAVVVTVTDVNEQPEFTGTPETAITLDEHDANDNYVVMDLADYSARDEEGGVSWSLTGTDRRDFAISADGVVTFAETPNYEAPEDSGGDNVYEFRVVATDVQSGSSRRNVGSDVTVTVGDVEEAGTLAVDNLNPSAGQTVTFRLTDPDGSIDTTNMTWVIQSLATGGSWARVSGVLTPAATTFPWTVDEDVTGKAIRAMVTYTDRRGSGKTALSQETAEVTADPIANAPPRFRGDSSWSVEEGPAGGAVGAPTTATDRDNDTLTYGIQPGGDSARFEIDPSSGQVRLAQALDFETTPGPLFFYLTLHDGRDADGVAEDPPVVDATRSATIDVVDVEEDGVVTLSDEEPGVATALTATLEDGDGGVSGPVWQWARSQNGRTGWSNISGATSSSYTTTQADPGFFLRATVSYTDRRGGGKSAEGITSQRVFGENQRPTFPPAEDGQRAIPENTRAGVSIGAPVAADDPESGALTYSLSGTDAAAFTIVTSTGQLRVRDALDFEAKPSHSVTVEVHDGLDELGNASTAVDDTQSVTITVGNVEEPGAVTLTTASGTMQARVEVTAALSDEDGPTVVAWQWSRSPDGRTDWVNIAGATAATYTPTLEEDRGNYLRATASYSDDHGPNKTAEQVSARVGDPPPVNSPPVFPQAEDGQREVEENAADGTAIGPPVEATDLNAGNAAVNDPLAYSLSGTDAASFDIDSGSGQLRVAPGVELDYEGKRSYRVTVEVSDGRDQNGDDDMAAIDARQHVTITVTNVNEAPVVTGDSTASFEENSSSAVASYTAADPERDTLTWSVSGDDFWVSDRGRLYFRTPPSFEGQTTYQVTVTATDDDPDTPLSGTLDVAVTVTDAEEAGVVTISLLRGWDGTTFQAVLDDDDGSISGEMWQWERSSNRSSWEAISGATSSTYAASSDDVDRYLRVTVTYEDTRGSGKEASAALTGRIEDSANRPGSNSAPAFAETAPERSVGQGTAAGRRVGAPVRATDEDTGDILTYSLSGTDAMLFDIDPTTGQLLSRAVLDYDPDGTNSYSVQVRVHDGYGPDYQSTDVGVDATTEVTITVTAAPATRGIVGGGGGGGGGGGPSPSTLDFEWTVTHDIESLDPTHDSPTGAWSDGATLWVLENGDGADDAVYAYDLETGERVEEREFKLDERNRAPRGVWSDGETLWVSDSGQNKLFAYDLESGERLPERDIALAERNRAARGIWSDGERMYVLDSIFVYDLESGELLAECALDAANNDPRGIWSDGVTVWVSDHGAKRLFAYRLPVRSGEPDAGEEDEGDKELERVRDEEFPNTILSRASNNSPRGLWSDGDVMYVADASDGKVYSYNMPDAIDARLASLTMSGIEIGEFSARETEYTGVAAEGVAETTVEAAAVQSGAGVVIDPPDADEEADGQQVALEGLGEITVTVTSADGSRTKSYRVAFGDAGQEPTPEPWAHCLRGEIAEGFSLVVSEGGSVEDLVVCAESRGVTALYALHEGVYVSYILGAPEWVNAGFAELFARGVPPVTPLTVKSNGPPSTDPNRGDGTPLPGTECLRGEIVVGFSLLVYAGGSVEELVACAESRDVVTLYALHEGVYVSYILGAPEFANLPFRELFADGLPSITPLVVRSEGTPQAN